MDGRDTAGDPHRLDPGRGLGPLSGVATLRHRLLLARQARGHLEQRRQPRLDLLHPAHLRGRGVERELVADGQYPGRVGRGQQGQLVARDQRGPVGVHQRGGEGHRALAQLGRLVLFRSLTNKLFNVGGGNSNKIPEFHHLALFI